MSLHRCLFVAAALTALAGCDRRKAPGADMVAAQSWNAAEPAEAVDPNDPHAGVDMGGPHGDPHAGMAMGGMGADPHGADPHAGMDMGGGAELAPDPARAIDPGKFLRGKLALGQGATIPGAGVVFLYVKAADAQGNPVGPPLAVSLLPMGSFPQPFELTERDQMIKGTQFGGDVVIIARVDQDENVDSKQPGDLIGQLRARVPADGLQVVLDTVEP